MLKKFYIFFFLLAGITLAAQGAKAAPFIEGFEDIPIMSGLKQVPGDNISFGNEETRLVEAILTGTKVGFKKVEAFYTSTLPQLGWTYQGKRDNTLIFCRESEVLEIARESVKPLTVRITVKSRL